MAEASFETERVEVKLGDTGDSCIVDVLWHDENGDPHSYDFFFSVGGSEKKPKVDVLFIGKEFGNIDASGLLVTWGKEGGENGGT